MLAKLSELMLIDVLRRCVESLPPQDTGGLAGLRDPSVGTALTLIYDDPAHDWTVETLARQLRPTMSDSARGANGDVRNAETTKGPLRLAAAQTKRQQRADGPQVVLMGW